MLSTRDLASLPDIDALKRLMQSLAMLDAILCREWEDRYFSFNCGWSAKEMMGSMRNGEGDHYFALFNGSGCWLKGFDHESPLSPFARKPPKLAEGLFQGMPSEFQKCLKEPAFILEETTFCIWRRYSDEAWQRGPVKFPPKVKDPDGSAALMQYLDPWPQTYHHWSTDYYDCEIPLSAVTAVYAHKPLDRRLLRQLNEEVSLKELADDMREIGYPSS